MAIQTNAGGGRFDFGSSNTNISSGASIGGAASGGLTGGSSTIYTGNKAVVDGHMESAQVESVDLSDLLGGGPLVMDQPYDQRLKEQKELEEIKRRIGDKVGGELGDDTPKGPFRMDLPDDVRRRDEGIAEEIKRRLRDKAGGELGDDTPKGPFVMDLPTEERRRQQETIDQIMNELRDKIFGGNNTTFNPDANPTPHTEPQTMDLPPELDPRRRTGLAPMPEPGPLPHLEPLPRPEFIPSNDGTTGSGNSTTLGPLPGSQPTGAIHPISMDEIREKFKFFDWGSTGAAGASGATENPSTQPSSDGPIEITPPFEWTHPTGLAPAPDPSDWQLQEMPEGWEPLEYRHDIYPGPGGGRNQYR